MIIRSDHPEYARLTTKWQSEKKPAEIECLSQRWQVVMDNDGPFFVSKGALLGFDERYDQNSFHR